MQSPSVPDRAFATKLQSTKLMIAVGIFATATLLVVKGFVSDNIWADVTQTVLIGYAFADVAHRFVERKWSGDSVAQPPSPPPVPPAAEPQRF